MLNIVIHTLCHAYCILYIMPCILIGKSEESLKVQQVIVETLEQLAKDNGLDTTTTTTEEVEKEGVSEGEVVREAEYNSVSVVKEGQEGGGNGVKEEVVVTKVTTKSANSNGSRSAGSIRKDKDDDTLNFPLL